MKLKRVTIEHFRGINEEKVIDLSGFNVFVGKNDAGKSTILKALDCALSGNACLPDDLNVNSERQGHEKAIIILEFEFEMLPDVVIDGTVQTNFVDEELLDENENLNIKYEIKFGSQKPSAKPFIKRKIYGENDFFTKTNSQLNSLLRSLGIDTDELEEDTPQNNKAKREVLRRYHEEHSTSFLYDYEGIPSSGAARMVKVGAELKKILPRFQYFKADTPLDDSDGAIQKHFKKIAKDRLESTAREIQADIEENVQEKLDRITNNMNEIFGDDLIKAEPIFDWSKVLDTKFISSREEEDLPLKSRGDGFRRVAMMAYFEYLAEEEAEDRQSIIFGFEEPETFLHPELQEQLQEKLKIVSERGYQVLLTTHSPVIVAKSHIEDVQHVLKTDGNYLIEPASKQLVSKDLGVNPNTAIIEECDIAKAFLFVEGSSDKLFLERVCDVYKEQQVIGESFEELGIKIVPIGGKDEVKNWINLRLIKATKTPFLIFLDSDKSSEESSPKMFTGHNMLEEGDYLFTNKRSIENYLTCDSMRRIYSRDDFEYTDWCDARSILSQAGNIRFAGVNSSKVDFIRHHLYEMTFEELKNGLEYSGKDEFLEVFELIKSKIG